MANRWRSFERSLIARGVGRAYARRYTCEIADHHASIAESHVREGGGAHEASLRADEALGTHSVLIDGGARNWCAIGRARPSLASFMLAAGWTLGMLCAGVGLGMLVAGLLIGAFGVDPLGNSFAVFAAWAHALVAYGIVTFVAIGVCWHGWTRGQSPWAVLGACAAVACVGGALTLGYRLEDRTMGEVVFGVSDVARAIRFALPIGVWVLFELIAGLVSRSRLALA